MEERREKVIKLYNKGKSQREIAEELQVSQMTVYRHIKYLKERGKIAERKGTRKQKETEKRIKERREKVKELYNKGKTAEEIQEELQASRRTIYRDKKYLKEQEENSKRNKRTKRIEDRREKVKELCDEFYGQVKIQKIFDKYILDCKNKFKKGTLTKDEVSSIGKIASVTEKYEDIVFYLKICTEFKNYKEALKFANSQIYNETLTKEEKDRIKQMKEKIQEIMKKQIAITALENGQGVKLAMSQSGLPETMVLELNHQLLQKAQENRNKQENDDGEEPKI